MRGGTIQGMTHPPAANEPSVGEPADRDTALPEPADPTLSDIAPADSAPVDPDESPTVPAHTEPAQTAELPALDEPAPHPVDEPAPLRSEEAAEDDAPRYEADYYAPSPPAEDPPAAEQPVAEQPVTPEQPATPEQPQFQQIPPSGAGTPPPPPPPPGSFFTGQGGFNRRALIRPTNGRYIAGVCAAVGRATNTDPILWRVLFAVMTLAGGIGLLAYLLGWLLIPAEGDTGSPVEAMFGRGRTTTSPPLVIIIAVGAVLTFAWVVSRNVGSAVLGLAVIVGTLALLARNNNRQPESPPPSTYPGFMGYSSAPPTYPSMQQETMTDPAQTDTTGLEDTPAPPVPPSPPWPPTPPMPAVPPLPPTPPGAFRPPFAPHGPYASTSPYAASLGYPMNPSEPMGAYPGLLAPTTPTKPPKPPKPPRQRSKLGRLTLSVVAIAMGLLFLVDLNGVSVPSTLYLGVVLALIAIGLIVGAWFGRARWLIPIGVVMTIVLAVGASANRFSNVQDVANLDVYPSTLAEVQPSYSTDVGNIHIDLSRVDFSGQTTDLEVDSTVGGNVEIVLPPTVDVVVKTDIQGGNAEILGKELGGGLNQQHTVTDNGTDGQGGGTLNLTVDVNFGNVEVHR